MTIKYIFSDIDGTLLNSHGQVSMTNKRIIQSCSQPLTLVSARAPQDMLPIIDQLQLQTPQIAFNGGVIFQGNSNHWHSLAQKPLDFEVVAQMVLLISKYFPQVSLSFYSLHHWYTQRCDRGIKFEEQLVHQTATIINYRDFFKQAKHKLFKIMLITFDPEEMDRLQKFSHDLNISKINIQQSGTEYLEITSEAAQKAAGIQKILQQENLTIQEAMAVGDGENDLSMLRLVGYPVAMANANYKVRSTARFVTKSNDDQGLGYAIEQLVNQSVWL